MIGRAGRPQFDTEGVAVIMTQKQVLHRSHCTIAGPAMHSVALSNMQPHVNSMIATKLCAT